MPSPPWGVRSIPEIDSRYPLWDQPNFMRDVDEGNFYLPDAEENLREPAGTGGLFSFQMSDVRLQIYLGIYGFWQTPRVDSGGCAGRRDQ
jgi:hypothetical protein